MTRLVGETLPGHRADADAYDARWTAVAMAAWIAALVACQVHEGQPVPLPLAASWDWLVDGHWPCGYDREAGKLVVL